MILLWMLLLLSSVNTKYLDHISNVTQYRDYCVRQHQLPAFSLSWLISITNTDTNKNYNGALISTKHILTIKEAVTTKVNGVEQMTKNLTLQYMNKYKDMDRMIVKHILIPVNYTAEKEEIILCDLAIIEVDSVEDDYDIAHICLNSLNITKGFRMSAEPHIVKTENGHEVPILLQEEWDFEENCADGCSGLMHSEQTYEQYAGDIWTSGEIQTKNFHGVPIIEMEKPWLLGLGINGTAGIRLRNWESFIFEHTGIGFFFGDKESEYSSIQKRSNHHYMIDGELILDECSEDYRLLLMKQSTLFNRITPEESEKTKENCGTMEIFESTVFIISTTNTCSIATTTHVPLTTTENVFAEFGPKEESSEEECEVGSRYCMGTYITSRHVVTSGACIKSLQRRGDLLRAAVVDAISRDRTISSIMVDGIGGMRGHKFVDVKRIAIPGGKISGGDDGALNIAILELAETVEGYEGSAKPMCVPRGGYFPPHVDVLDVTTVEPNVKDPFTIVFLSAIGLHRESFAVFFKVEPQSTECYFDKLNLDGELPEGFPCVDLRLSPIIPELGASLSDGSLGRRYLYAVASRSGESNWASRLTPRYASFICIYTGLCQENEKYKYTFTPFQIQSTHIRHSIWALMNERKNRPALLQYDEIQEDNRNSSDHTEYFYTVQHVFYVHEKKLCGRKKAEHTYSVDIGVLQQNGDLKSMCTGAFISNYFVITSRKCILPIMNDRLAVHYGPNETHWILSDTYALDTVKRVIYPGRRGTVWENEIDIAILEVSEPEDELNAILRDELIVCLPNNDDELEDEITWSGGEIIDNHRTQTLTVQDIVPSDTGKEKFSTYWTRDEKIFKEVDLGSPWVRFRKADDRMVLYGVTTTFTTHKCAKGLCETPQVTRIQSVLKLICRMSGVCPATKEKRNAIEEDIYVNGHRVCPNELWDD